MIEKKNISVDSIIEFHLPKQQLHLLHEFFFLHSKIFHLYANCNIWSAQNISRLHETTLNEILFSFLFFFFFFSSSAQWNYRKRRNNDKTSMIMMMMVGCWEKAKRIRKYIYVWYSNFTPISGIPKLHTYTQFTAAEREKLFTKIKSIPKWRNNFENFVVGWYMYGLSGLICCNLFHSISKTAPCQRWDSGYKFFLCKETTIVATEEMFSPLINDISKFHANHFILLSFITLRDIIISHSKRIKCMKRRRRRIHIDRWFIIMDFLNIETRKKIK